MSEKALCEVNMTYATMRSYFRAAERARQHLSGFIVFSPASFDKEYSVESRTYAVSSDNKAFRPNMGGYSILCFVPGWLRSLCPPGTVYGIGVRWQERLAN